MICVGSWHSPKSFEDLQLSKCRQLARRKRLSSSFDSWHFRSHYFSVLPFFLSSGLQQASSMLVSSWEASAPQQYCCLRGTKCVNLMLRFCSSRVFLFSNRLRFSDPMDELLTALLAALQVDSWDNKKHTPLLLFAHDCSISLLELNCLQEICFGIPPQELLISWLIFNFYLCFRFMNIICICNNANVYLF